MVNFILTTDHSPVSAVVYCCRKEPFPSEGGIFIDNKEILTEEEIEKLNGGYRYLEDDDIWVIVDREGNEIERVRTELLSFMRCDKYRESARIITKEELAEIRKNHGKQ